MRCVGCDTEVRITVWMVRIPRTVMKRIEIMKRGVKNPMRWRMTRILKMMPRTRKKKFLNSLDPRRETTFEILVIKCSHSQSAAAVEARFWASQGHRQSRAVQE